MANFSSLTEFQYRIPKNQSQSTPVTLNYRNTFSYSDAEFSNPHGGTQGNTPGEFREILAPGDFTSTRYDSKSDCSRAFYALTPGMTTNQPVNGAWVNPLQGLGIPFAARDTLLHTVSSDGVSYFGSQPGPITTGGAGNTGGPTPGAGNTNPGPSGGQVTGGQGGGVTQYTGPSGNVYSDSRLKENISLIGKSKSGIPLYEFNYKGSMEKYQGTMAQDLLTMNRKDVVTQDNDGYYMVNYNKIDIDLIKL